MTTHQGSCHCGGIVFQIDACIDELMTCDCSLCARRNAVMAVVPEDALKLVSGEAHLSCYTWNTGLAKHYFCCVCGIYVFHRKRAMQKHFGVNVFCLDGFDPTTLHVRAGEGVSMSVVDLDARPEWPGPRVGP